MVHPQFTCSSIARLRTGRNLVPQKMSHSGVTIAQKECASDLNYLHNRSISLEFQNATFGLVPNWCGLNAATGSKELSQI